MAGVVRNCDCEDSRAQDTEYEDDEAGSPLPLEFWQFASFNAYFFAISKFEKGE